MWHRPVRLPSKAPHQVSGLARERICLPPPPTPLDRVFHHPDGLASCVTPSLHLGGAGMLTGSPSATPLGLTLGPGLPWADEPSPGNLGLSARGILTPFIATYAGILSSLPSSAPHGTPSSSRECSPTTVCHQDIQSVASVADLSPATFSAQRRSTSELLRTL